MSSMDDKKSALVEKYGDMKIKKRCLLKRPSHARKYFDSGDWMLQKQGKPLPIDSYLEFNDPSVDLPVKTEPTRPSAPRKTNLSTVYNADSDPPGSQTSKVVDI